MTTPTKSKPKFKLSHRYQFTAYSISKSRPNGLAWIDYILEAFCFPEYCNQHKSIACGAVVIGNYLVPVCLACASVAKSKGIWVLSAADVCYVRGSYPVAKFSNFSKKGEAFLNGFI